MRRRDYYWSLFHLPEKRQLTDLRTDQVEAIFEAISNKDRKDWVIWREGFRSWKHFADFPDLLTSLRKAQAMSPPASVPPQAPGQSSTSDDTQALGQAPSESSTTRLRQTLSQIPDALDLSLMSEDEAVEDRDQRYPRKFEIAIYANDRIIKNATVDVSMRGMQLRDAVPPGLSRFFHVEIKSHDKMIPVVCSVVATQDGAPSKRLRIEVNEHPDVLLTAILSN